MNIHAYYERLLNRIIARKLEWKAVDEPMKPGDVR